MNVVLVVLDSLRKDHVGAYGGDRARTPNLDAVAKESLRFTRSHPESLPTVPARRALHTGIRAFPFGNWSPPGGRQGLPAGTQPVPEEQITLAEVLGEQGYSTVLFSDAYPLFEPYMNFHRGFAVYDWIRGQGNDRYRPASTVSDETLQRYVLPGNDQDVVDGVRQHLANAPDRRAEEDYSSPRLFSRAAEFIERAGEGLPFFLTVDSFDPHEPWDPPEEYAGPSGDGPEPTAPNNGPAGYLSDAQLERMRDLYAGEVEMVDAAFGRLVDAMRSAGRLNDTLLVVISGNGVALGEHDATGKPPYALWPEVTDVPFMIRHPGGNAAGTTSDFFASTHDVFPTILGALGVLPPGPTDGVYLSQLDGFDPEPRDHFTLGHDDHVWARDDRYAMFARNDRSGARLYDVAQDPGMNNDIAADNPDVVERMFDDYVLKDAGGSLPKY